MKAVFLDSGVIDPGDISWSSVEAICDFVKYDDTPEEQAHERLKKTRKRSSLILFRLQAN